MDWEYSRSLVLSNTSADTVDGLRIYKETREHYEWYGLEELLGKELVFETEDKTYIRKFVLAAQEWIDTTGIEDVNDRASLGCGWLSSRWRESVKYYVVMFDNTFKRAGYFMVVLCDNQEEPHMEISLAEDEGFSHMMYYNEALIPILREIDIYYKEKKLLPKKDDLGWVR